MNSKLIYISLWAVCLLATSCGTMQQPLLSDYVDPNIGTAHSRWFFYTPAAVPFGMAKVGPSTDAHYGNEQGWEAVGYDFRHESLEGFANFHEFQIGGVVLAPLTGALKTTREVWKIPMKAIDRGLIRTMNMQPQVSIRCY